jgi:hypothetical protein
LVLSARDRKSRVWANQAVKALRSQFIWSIGDREDRSKSSPFIFEGIHYFYLKTLVSPQKAQKIDINQNYPCHCRRRGTLRPIALTEAFGCDRCQQIFAVEDNGYVLEQLSTSYPYKRAWRWTGNRWVAVNASFQENYLRFAIGFAIVVLIATIYVIPIPQEHRIIVTIILAVLLLALLTFMLWSSYRH